MGLQKQLLTCNAETINHYYLCHYRPRSAGPDELSQSLIRFKRGWPLHVQAWTECSISALKDIKIKKGSLIIRPLNSNELAVTTPSNTPLDELGRKIHLEFECQYLPHSLIKTKKTERIKTLSRSEREQALFNAYKFNPPDLVNGIDEVLIIDDILTSGATMRAVVASIRLVLPDKPIQIFTLASTEYQSLLNDSVQLRTFRYEWEPTKGWMVVDEDAELYMDLELLKQKIFYDSFK